MAQIGWGLHFIIFLRTLAETNRPRRPERVIVSCSFPPPFYSERGGPPPVFGGVGFWQLQ